MRRATKRAVRRARAGKPRARPVDPKVKRARIYEIAGVMARKEWRKGKSDRELALRWKVALATVQDMSAEASRLLSWTGEDREQLIVWCKVELQKIVELGEDQRVMALRTLLSSLGALQYRHQVTHSFDPTAGWTDDEIDRFNATGELPDRVRTKP